MKIRFLYALIGFVISIVVDILINILANGLQRQIFPEYLSAQTLWILAGLALGGLTIGYWLGHPIHVPPISPSHKKGTRARSSLTSSPQDTTITRLRALLSYSKLKGRGIHLSDILLLGLASILRSKDG